jgi:DHA1 family bicyclomycin/chloramphenicol resistance-like MFS transporter
MKTIKENHHGISTMLAFALIPLSGFATDIYIPSLPTMARDLHVSTSAVQLSLVLFFISSGISQLFIGAILDSFGRYRAGLFALAVFAIASFTIAIFPDIYVIYAMRIVQGITISLIVVGKRAFFVDMYSGEKLKHYTSLFVIIWSTAPILAPFIGGYLQSVFGWQSSFYFLGILAVLFLVLELIYSGESLKHFHPFKAKKILDVYGSMIKTGDFAIGLIMIGSLYGLIVMYGMASPFIIERVLKFSPVLTGYSSLLSGLSVMVGGIVAKALIKIPFTKKIITAIALQAIFAGLMIFTPAANANIYSLIGFTICIHTCGGFIFNNVYSYCLGRFSKNAGTASGLTGGGMYIVSSLFSYGLVNLFAIKNQALLGAANLSVIVFIVILFIVFNRYRNARLREDLIKAAVASL